MPTASSQPRTNSRQPGSAHANPNSSRRWVNVTRALCTGLRASVPPTRPESVQRNAASRPSGWSVIRAGLLWVSLLGAALPLSAGVLITTDSVWRYRKGTNEVSSPTNAWRELNYNSGAWTSGAAPFYYDEGGGAYTGNTVLDDMRYGYTTVYLRQTFVITNRATLAGLQLRALCDDGFVAWINGSYFTNLNQVSGNYSHTNTASSLATEPLQWFVATLQPVPASVTEGSNVLAVQLFNRPITSSDLMLAVELSALESDLDPPTLQAVQPPPGIVADLATITVTFSEPVVGVAGSDLRVNGVPSTGVTGAGAVYTFSVDRPPDGPVTVSWDPGAWVTDLAVPPNRFDPTSPAASWQYELVDATAPVIVGLTPPPGAVVTRLDQVSVTFSEPVTGVGAADLLVDGQPAGQVSGSSAGPYVFGFPARPEGAVQFGWAGNHGIRDLAASPNAFAGGSWTVTVDTNAALGRVRINEILTSYSGVAGLADEDDELQDWIELWNTGTNSMNLTGWSLSDDPEDPDQWTLPNLTLGAGRYLVVFASGKDRKPTAPGARLHTNFKQTSAGEFLALYDANSPRRMVSGFAPSFPEQRSDHSWGYDPAGALRYFATPTPGASNGLSAIRGVVPPVHFNVQRGVFDQPFQLILSDELAGSTIRFTLDGSEPSPGSGQVYQQPLVVSNTTVVRAVGFLADHLPSTIGTHSYLFPRQVIQQPANPPGVPSVWIDTQNRTWTADYEMDPEITTDPQYREAMFSALTALPVLSVVMKPEDLFDNSNGIYPKSQARGPSWERPASVEWIYPDGRPPYQIDCGIQCQGNSTRDPVKTPKHAFRLVFKGDYGARRLDYEVFPESPLRTFDTLVLRADFNYSWLHWDPTQRLRAQRTRDGFMKDTLRAMGGLASHNAYVHLYLNGLYWGIYDPSERPDAAFAAAHLGGEKEEYDVVNEGAAVDGTLGAYNQMQALTNLVDNAQYDQMHGYLEVTRHIDYVLAHFYVGHRDWGYNKNWYALRRRAAGAGFHYVPWDGENILEGPAENRVSSADTPSGLHTRMMTNSQYRLDFADRVQRHVFDGGALTTEACRDRWLRRAAALDLAILAESARWGDYRRDIHQYSSPPYELYTRNGQWLAEQDRLLNTYFPVRTANLLAQLKSAGLYPTNATTPRLQPPGGTVAPGTAVALSATAGSIYYTTDGTDPRVRFTAAVAPGAQLYQDPLVLSQPVRIRARSRLGGEWSALAEAVYQLGDPRRPVRITEIMYHPAGGEPYEFVEIQNTGSVAVDLSGFHWTGIEFVFPPGSWIQPGQFVVLASSMSPGSFATRYPGVAVTGYFEDNLSNGGERLALLDPNGRVVVSVDYDDANGWPPSADGSGASLEVVDAASGSDEPANWQASAAAGGSPGRASVVAPPSGMRLNEVMADNRSAVSHAGAFPDWIELHNAGSQSVNLEGWSLTDDDDPRRYVFPAGTQLPSGDYLVVYCDTNITAPGLHSGFALGRQGETLFLFDERTNRVDALSFGFQLPDLTIGRHGPAGEWALCVPTLELPNVAQPTAAPGQLVLNEWLANAVPGTDDWLELFNRDASLPVALRGLFLQTSNALARIDALSFIPAQGFSLLVADEQSGPDHLGLRLPAEGGWLAMLDAAGSELDRVVYGPQVEGLSAGRLPDAASAIRPFPGSASPGTNNYVLTYAGPVLHEILAWNAGVVTNAAGVAADFIELFNPGTTPFELSGMRLGTGPDPADAWAFPANTVVGGHDWLVVWFDPERPASTNLDAWFNSGRGLSRQGGEISLWAPDGRRLDSLRYGNQVRNLSVGRSTGGWALLIAPTPRAANAAPSPLASTSLVRINEWMPRPVHGEDWVELHNTAAQPVALEGCGLSNDGSLAAAYRYRFGPLSFLEAGGFLLLEDTTGPTPPSLGFDLDGDGAMIRLTDPAGQGIDAVYFGAKAAGVSAGRLPDGAERFVEFTATPSPEARNFLPLANARINEVLTHTDPPFEDAIELYNPSGLSVDLGGWFLSDDERQLEKYRIADDTVLPPGGYAVFYEGQLIGGAGSLVPFTFDSVHGDAVYLSQTDIEGQLTGYRDQVSFGAAPNGLPFGRIPTGIGDQWALLSRPTFGVDQPATVAEFRGGQGAVNAPARVPAAVISEIMYQPPTLPGDLTEERMLEYVEVHNRLTEPLPLYDPASPTNTWRLGGGIEFEFPQETSLAPGTCLLVVGFDPVADPSALAAFRGRYLLPSEVPVFGPFRGRLANEADAVLLLEPDRPQPAPGPEAGYVPYFTAEPVHYQPTAPWPGTAAGGGASLQRTPDWAYADDPLAWVAGAPTPGADNSAPVPTNQPPVLSQVPSHSVVEGEPLHITLVAADADVPAQRLTFALLEHPPGVSLDAASGELAWTPTELQGPATHAIQVRVTDNGVPMLGATQSFVVTVLESNLPPVLAPVPSQSLDVGSTLALQLSASDPDLPPNALAFELVSGPAGAWVDAGSGWFTWTAAVADGGRTHAVVIRVADDGVPALARETQFSVSVPLQEPLQVTEVSVTGGVVAVVWATNPGMTYAVQYTDDLASGRWWDLVRGLVASGSTLRHVDAPPPDSRARFYRIVTLP